jgi:hypothetical protein
MSRSGYYAGIEVRSSFIIGENSRDGQNKIGDYISIVETQLADSHRSSIEGNESGTPNCDDEPDVDEEDLRLLSGVIVATDATADDAEDQDGSKRHLWTLADDSELAEAMRR